MSDEREMAKYAVANKYAKIQCGFSLNESYKGDFPVERFVSGIPLPESQGKIELNRCWANMFRKFDDAWRNHQAGRQI